MLKPASPSLHFPLAFCALLALGACLDHSAPLTGPRGKGQDSITLGPDVGRPVEPDGGNGGSGNAFDRLPIRERFDSSLQAMRRLKSLSKDSYAYVVGGTWWIGNEDSTRVTWSYGTAAAREVWYTWWSEDQLNLFQNKGHFREGAGEIGSHPQGAQALSLDSLYAICRLHLPSDTGTNRWFSLDSNRILRQCGSYDPMWQDVFPQVEIERVEWFVPKLVTDTVPACIMIAPRPDQQVWLSAEE